MGIFNIGLQDAVAQGLGLGQRARALTQQEEEARIQADLARQRFLLAQQEAQRQAQQFDQRQSLDVRQQDFREGAYRDQQNQEQAERQAMVGFGADESSWTNPTASPFFAAMSPQVQQTVIGYQIRRKFDEEKRQYERDMLRSEAEKQIAALKTAPLSPRQKAYVEWAIRTVGRPLDEKDWERIMTEGVQAVMDEADKSAYLQTPVMQTYAQQRGFGATGPGNMGPPTANPLEDMSVQGVGRLYDDLARSQPTPFQAPDPQAVAYHREALKKRYPRATPEQIDGAAMSLAAGKPVDLPEVSVSGETRQPSLAADREFQAMKLMMDAEEDALKTIDRDDPAKETQESLRRQTARVRTMRNKMAAHLRGTPFDAMQAAVQELESDPSWESLSEDEKAKRLAERYAELK